MNPRGFFWSGVIRVNDRTEHAFFEVRSKKKTVGGHLVIHLITQDLPPLPCLHPEDSFLVTFYLENSMGHAPVRHKVTQIVFEGAMIDPKATGDSLLVKTESAEWQFARVPKPPDETDEEGSIEISRPSGSSSSGDTENWNPWFMKELRVKLPEKVARAFFAL